MKLSRSRAKEARDHRIVVEKTEAVLRSFFARSQSLICENGARVIQSWFREIYSTNAAALVITRFARQYVAMKRAKSYLQKLKHESMAATTIQCRIRAIGANLKFKLIDQQLQSSLQAVEEEFNENGSSHSSNRY